MEGEENISQKLKSYNSLGAVKASDKKYQITSQPKDDFELLSNQSIDAYILDKQNLPPIILPQIPHKMRASQM